METVCAPSHCEMEKMSFPFGHETRNKAQPYMAMEAQELTDMGPRPVETQDNCVTNMCSFVSLIHCLRGGQQDGEADGA